jgi:hypothetical protein
MRIAFFVGGPLDGKRLEFSDFPSHWRVGDTSDKIKLRKSCCDADFLVHEPAIRIVEYHKTNLMVYSDSMEFIVYSCMTEGEALLALVWNYKQCTTQNP